MFSFNQRMEASSLEDILSSPSPDTYSPTEEDSEGTSSSSQGAFTYPGSADENDNEVQWYKLQFSSVIRVYNNIRTFILT